MTTLRLTRVPPSLHQLYARGKGRTYKKPEYITWQKQSQAEILLQGKPKFTEPVDIEIRIPREAVRASSDADNRQKAVCDLLVLMKIIPDDKSTHVRSCKAEFCADIDQTEIIITAVEKFEPIGEIANRVVAQAGEAMRK